MPRGTGKSTRSERLRRPKAGRSEPVRNWETLFGPPADGPEAPDGRSRAGVGDASNPVAKGVELGYRVMDEYVRRQGQRAAGLRGAPAGSARGFGDSASAADRANVSICLGFRFGLDGGDGGHDEERGRHRGGATGGGL